MAVVLPPLVFRICPVGTLGMPAFGIELSNHTFSAELPMLFKRALEFMCDRQSTQLYWVLRINSPGGCVENVLKPILDSLYNPSTPPFFTVCEGMSASCGAILYMAGWASPRGLGGHVCPRGQLMFHRIQLGSDGGSHDESNLTTEGVSVRRTQSELSLEVNRVFLSNTADHYQSLETLQHAINTDQLYEREHSIRIGKWPEDFQDIIECYRRDDGEIDEEELLKAFGERLPYNVEHGAVAAWGVDNKRDAKYYPSRWYIPNPDRDPPPSTPVADTFTSRLNEFSSGGVAEPTVNPIPSSPGSSSGSVFLPYSVWYISREYDTEASGRPDLTSCWKTKVCFIWGIIRMVLHSDFVVATYFPA